MLTLLQAFARSSHFGAIQAGPAFLNEFSQMIGQIFSD
jgi:hypothetical protein